MHCIFARRGLCAAQHCFSVCDVNDAPLCSALARLASAAPSVIFEHSDFAYAYFLLSFCVLDAFRKVRQFLSIFQTSRVDILLNRCIVGR